MIKNKNILEKRLFTNYYHRLLTPLNAPLTSLRLCIDSSEQSIDHELIQEILKPCYYSLMNLYLCIRDIFDFSRLINDEFSTESTTTNLK